MHGRRLHGPGPGPGPPPPWRRRATRPRCPSAADGGSVAKSGVLAPVGPLRSGFRPPPLAPWRGPLASARRRSGASPAACGGTAAPWRSPPRLAGSACRRLRSPAPPPPRPAPLRRAPAPPAGGPGAVPRPSPWVPLVAVAPLRGPWRAPCALLRLPPAPGAAPGGGAPWRGPSASLRASGSGAPAPGPWSGAGPGGPAWCALAGRGPGVGVPPPAGGGRGDHLASWASWRLRVVWPWLSRGVGRGPFRAVSKGIWAPLSITLESHSTVRFDAAGVGGGASWAENRPFLLEISRNIVHFADCRRRPLRGTLIVQRTGARRSA